MFVVATDYLDNPEYVPNLAPRSIPFTEPHILRGLDMSHFAYACKMRYPLNFVLESWEYLWFY